MKMVLHDLRITPRSSCAGQMLFKWLVVVFLVTGAASGFVLMMAHQKHQDELARVREESAREVRLTTEEVERLKADVATASPAADNTELVKLRGEVAELRRQQQLWLRTVTENKQLQETARQWMQAATEGTSRLASPGAPPPSPAVVNLLPTEGVNVGNLGDKDDPSDGPGAIPGTVPDSPQKDPQAAACIANLQGIAGAKATWGLEYHKQGTDVPQEGELFGLNKYLTQKPVCPSGGVYTMGAVGEKARCSLPGHAL